MIFERNKHSVVYIHHLFEKCRFTPLKTLGKQIQRGRGTSAIHTQNTVVIVAFLCNQSYTVRDFWSPVNLLLYGKRRRMFRLFPFNLPQFNL